MTSSETLRPWKQGFFADIALGTLLADPFSVVDTLRRLVMESDLVVRCNDAGHREAVAFADILSLGGLEPDTDPARLPPVAHMQLYDLTNAHVDKLTASLSRFRSNRKRPLDVARPWMPNDTDELYGRGKDFFDYNWAVNAAALLAPILQEAGVDAVVPRDRMRVSFSVPSTALATKNVMLVLLHLARSVEPIEIQETRLVSRMSNWQGSGKFRNSQPMGSPVSNTQNLYNMRRLGLLEDGSPPPPTLSGWLQEKPEDPVLSKFSALARAMLDDNENGGHASTGDWLIASRVFRRKTSYSGGIETSVSSNHPAFKLLNDIADGATIFNVLDATVDKDICLQLGVLVQPRSPVRLSDRGRRLARLLPKSAYDPDLPSRLHTWCEAWPSSRPQMSAYIQRYFGNVKRSNGMRALAGNAGDPTKCAQALLSRAADTASAARTAQVSAEVLAAAAGGVEVTVAQATAIILAEERLASPAKAPRTL